MGETSTVEIRYRSTSPGIPPTVRDFDRRDPVNPAGRTALRVQVLGWFPRRVRVLTSAIERSVIGKGSGSRELWQG